MMADLFPVTTRASGMAIGYNIAVTVFGGFAPFICTLLITATGTKLAPSYYLMMVALLSLWALIKSQSSLALLTPHPSPGIAPGEGSLSPSLCLYLGESFNSLPSFSSVST